MSTTTILALQSVLVMLQILNAGLATLRPPLWVPLFVAVIMGGLQYFLQNLGNNTVASPKNMRPVPDSAGAK